MNKSYCRPLCSDVQVEPFIDAILDICNEEDLRNAVNLITSAEKDIQFYEGKSTLTHHDFRDFKFRSDDKRHELRMKIISELVSFERPENDDDIAIENGGAKPRTTVQSDNKAFIVIGPPASGKSRVASSIADSSGSYILDSDYAKRKLPEYNIKIGSASLIHEESSKLIFNYESSDLLTYCISNKYNMVIPKIGNSKNVLIKFCEELLSVGYTIYLICIDLDRKPATKRAFHRYKNTRRYVPLSLIFDGFGNDPVLNYFRIIHSKSDSKIFSGYAQISTDVPLGSKFILVDVENIDILKTMPSLLEIDL